MAAIVNDRDVLMQATSPRVVSGGASKGIILSASSSAFQVSTTGVGSPSSITLTAALIGITGAVVTFSTSPTTTLGVSGNVATLAYANMSANSVAVTATVVDGGVTYTNTQTITKLNALGALATQSTVNLATQVTGYLNSGSITGLGALSALNYINLASGYVTGTIDANTQVNNLGTLAFANSIAANQIGAGTLAVGVAYAGTVNAAQVNAGTFVGHTYKTAGSGTYVALNESGNNMLKYYIGGSSVCEIGGSSGIIWATSGSSLSSTISGIATGPLSGVTGSAGSGNGVSGYSTSGNGVMGTVSSGKGISGNSSSGGYGGYFTASSGVGLYCSGNQALSVNGVIIQSGTGAANLNSIVPAPGSTLGTGGNPWATAYVTGGAWTGSDRRLKTIIRDSDLGLAFINSLRPRVYKMRVGNTVRTLEPEQAGPGADGLPIPQGVITTTTPGVRDHYGLITQELREALGTDSVAMWALADKDDPESSQYIIYTELIAPMIKAIQELSAEVKTLKAANA